MVADPRVEQLMTGGKSVVSIEDIRNEIRDKEGFNEISKLELKDEEIADEIVQAIDDFNMLPPFFSQYGLFDFPDRILLINMGVENCLSILIKWHARNQFSASDAGLEVPIHEQWQGLQQLVDRMSTKNEDRAQKLKTMLNIQRGWGGGVGSPIGWGYR